MVGGARGGTTEPDGRGEQLVAAWVRDRGFSFEYEAKVGGRTPDFLICSPYGAFVLEMYEPELRLTARVGAISPTKAIRGLFRDNKKKQATAVRKAGLPFVAAIAETRSDIPFDPLLVAGAMLGDLSVEISIDLNGSGTSNLPESRSVFGSNAPLQKEFNRGVSAVGVVRSFNPTRYRLDKRFSEVRNRGGKPRTSRDRCLIGDERVRVENEAIAAGDFLPHAAKPRLLLFHNPHAQYVLPFTQAGRWDQQWALRNEGDGTGSYGLVAEGTRCWEIPGRP